MAPPKKILANLSTLINIYARQYYERNGFTKKYGKWEELNPEITLDNLM